MLFISVIQAVYDFLGWYVILGEPYVNWRDYTWKEWSFRIIKFILDFPVTIYALLYFNIPIESIALFYLAKWLGVCDLFYLIIHILWTGEEMFEVATWFWWQPYAIYERIKRGYVYTTNVEFLIQAIIGLEILIIVKDLL